MKALLISIAILAACAPVTPPPAQTSAATAGIELDAERKSATTVALTLRNQSPDAAGYNLCSSTLERRGGDTWTPVPSEEMCTMELRTLAAGASAPYTKTLPPTLPAGEYRYVAHVETPLGGNTLAIASDSFTVP